MKMINDKGLLIIRRIFRRSRRPGAHWRRKRESSELGPIASDLRRLQMRFRRLLALLDYLELGIIHSFNLALDCRNLLESITEQAVRALLAHCLLHLLLLHHSFWLEDLLLDPLGSFENRELVSKHFEWATASPVTVVSGQKLFGSGVFEGLDRGSDGVESFQSLGRVSTEQQVACVDFYDLRRAHLDDGAGARRRNILHS